MARLLPGQLLGGTSYEVVRELAAGGMGVVYEVEHIRLQKRYVAKIVQEDIENDAEALARIEREAKVLARMSHPNIVQVHDAGMTGDKTRYLIMEKLEGYDLRRWMKTRHVTTAEALGITAEVLDALAYLHAHGVVHRDIKPANVFMANQAGAAVIKVLDFGIVHLFDVRAEGERGLTKTGMFLGTLEYAAPEQMQGKPASPATDVYAAGLLLFELVAGKGPFDGDPGLGLSRCFKPAPVLADVVAAPRELSDLIARALDRDPAARPTASALAQDLRRLGAELPAPPSDRREDDPIAAEVEDLLLNIGRDGERPAAAPAAPVSVALLPTEAPVPATTQPHPAPMTTMGDAPTPARDPATAPLPLAAPRSSMAHATPLGDASPRPVAIQVAPSVESAASASRPTTWSAAALTIGGGVLGAALVLGVVVHSKTRSASAEDAPSALPVALTSAAAVAAPVAEASPPPPPTREIADAPPPPPREIADAPPPQESAEASPSPIASRSPARKPAAAAPSARRPTTRKVSEEGYLLMPDERRAPSEKKASSDGYMPTLK